MTDCTVGEPISSLETDIALFLKIFAGYVIICLIAVMEKFEELLAGLGGVSQLEAREWLVVPKMAVSERASRTSNLTFLCLLPNFKFWNVHIIPEFLSHF